MAKLTYLKINGYEIKQLWYGKFKAIYESDYNMVYSTYSCENVLTYTETPQRDLSGNIRNEDIETFYVPKATFRLSYVNEDIYSILLELLNQKSFTVEYYDYELRRHVVRDMYMTEHSLNALHILGADLKGFIDVNLSFVSRKSYSDYLSLIRINEPTNVMRILDLVTITGYGYQEWGSSDLFSETILVENHSPVPVAVYIDNSSRYEDLFGSASESIIVEPHTLGSVTRYSEEPQDFMRGSAPTPTYTCTVEISYSNVYESRVVTMEDRNYEG